MRELLNPKKDKKIGKEKKNLKRYVYKNISAPKISIPTLFGKQNMNQNQKNKANAVMTEMANKEFTVRPMNVNNQTWVYPPMSLLRDVSQQGADRGDTKQYAQTIEDTLGSFGIRARVDEVNGGPSVTQYALQITQGTKLAKITALSSDLALAWLRQQGRFV